MAAIELETSIAGSEPQLNFRTTAGSLGIPVGVKIAEVLRIIPPQTGETYTLLVFGSALVGLYADTVIHGIKTSLREAEIVQAELEKNGKEWIKDDLLFGSIRKSLKRKK